jgi:hypothetical protein
MPTESIIFSPELDERQLDRETGKVNESLSEATDDIQANIGTEMDSLSPAGVGGAGGGGGGGVGGAAGAAGLASKIPKPVAGVAAASALPIALAGGVGLKIASEMVQQSARLQTSASILSQAQANVFRPLGDKVDQLFVRDLVTDILDETQAFAEDIRRGDFLEGAIQLSTGFDFQEDGIADAIGAAVGGAFGGPLGSRVGSDIASGIVDGWDGWPDVGGLFPGWPNIQAEWPGFPDVQAEWNGWPTIQPVNLASKVTSVNLVNQVTPVNLAHSVTGVNLSDFVTGINLGNFIDIPEILSSGNDPGGDPPPNGGGDFGDPFDGGNRGRSFGGPRLQTGGRVTGTGVATVDRGELVTDEQRLVSELADAIGVRGARGGGGGSADMSGVEQRLDRLSTQLRRLESALDVSVQVGREEIARATTDGRRNRVADTDPTT